jgi:hypothetical protein
MAVRHSVKIRARRRHAHARVLRLHQQQLPSARSWHAPERPADPLAGGAESKRAIESQQKTRTHEARQSTSFFLRFIYIYARCIIEGSARGVGILNLAWLVG